MRRKIYRFHRVLALVLTIVALAVGQSAWATLSTYVEFKGYYKTIGNTNQYAWGIGGNHSDPQQTGTSQTFNGEKIDLDKGNSVTITGTFNFAQSDAFTDITTGSQVTLVFNSPQYWFYGATVKTLSDGSVSGCSYSTSNDRRTITVTIPSGKTFGRVYLDYVAKAPLTNSNTTVTVPAGDYWVSNSSHMPTPAPTVTYSGSVLTQGTDYTLSWSNNSSAGTGTVTVTGTGEYAGTATGTFSIRWATYTVRFNKNNDSASGTMSDMAFTYNTAQNLTANAFTAPTGYNFAGWNTAANGSGDSYTNGQSVTNLTPVDGAVIDLYAQWSMPYIDADGNEQSIIYPNFTFLESSTGSTVNLGTAGAATWYVAKDVVSITYTNDSPLYFNGAVHLILMDGATLTVEGRSPISAFGSLTIYGQSLGTGSLKATGSGTAILVNEASTGVANNGTLTINGGNITANSTGNNGISAKNAITINGGSVNATSSGLISHGITSTHGDITINGGTVSATGGKQGNGIYGNSTITINGGNVSATGGIYGIQASTITLGWRNASDRIYASSYSRDPVVKSGQILTDGTNFYIDTVERSKIAGKTLQPATAIDLADNADNNGLITAANGLTLDVTLEGRTLYKDGAWNTLCLPFNLTLSGSVLDGDNVDVRTLSSSSFSNGTLTLNFTDKGAVTELVAGTPYIIKWSKSNESDPDLTNLVNPVFTGVTVSNATNDFTSGNVTFKGTYSPVTFEAENKSILFLGGNNKLYYPDGTATTTIGAFRSYFLLTAFPDPSQGGVKEFRLNFDGEDSATSMYDESLTPALSKGEGAIFNLAGQRLSKMQRGINIVNGKKVLY